MPDDEYLDGIRSSTSRYRRRIDQALERFRARSFLARHDLRPDEFVLLAGRRRRHPFADVHPFCCAAAMDERLLCAEAPRAAVDFVLLLKYFRALYDWQRWHPGQGGLGRRKGVFDEALEAWLAGAFGLGISFESDRGRARFVEPRWKEFAFPLELVHRTWEHEGWAEVFADCRAQFEQGVLRMFEAVDSMGREILSRSDAAGVPFEVFWRSSYEGRALHRGAEALKLAKLPEFMWIPETAWIPKPECIRHWHEMAAFAVADMFVRRMARKERPIGSGRAGLCAYLAAGALGAELAVFKGVFGGDTVTLENALLLKKRFGHDFDGVLQMVLNGKMALELYEMTGRPPRSLM